MISERIELAKRQISESNPGDLESWVRGLLIHYFFHVSDRSRLELFDLDADSPRSINVLTPTVFKGMGRIRLAPFVVFGVPRSPDSYACSYIEARTPESVIEIGARTVINNHAFLLSEGAQIRIGKRGLIGPELQVFDSNAHRLTLGERNLPDNDPRPVQIGDDVFIGARVTILKGCQIGDGCVISAGCVIPPSFVAPPFSIIAGNPGRIIGRAPEPSA